MEETSVPTRAEHYGVLHLREGAPRELVEETYWFLVRKLRYGVIDDIEGLRRLDRLNSAYESIARNGAHAESQPVARNGAARSGAGARRWGRRRGRQEQPALDPYETLFVTEDADADIALLSSKVLAAWPPSHMDQQEWNRTLADATAKLADPAWRSAVGQAAATAPEDAVTPGVTPAVSPDAVSPDGVTPMEPAVHDAPPHIAPIDEAELEVEPAEVAVPGLVVERDDSVAEAPEGSGELEHMDDADLDEPDQADEAALDAEPAVALAQAEEAAPDSQARGAIEQTYESALDPEVVERTNAGAEARADGNEPSGLRALLDRILTRKEVRDAIIEAENERLLMLRGESIAIISPPAEHDARPNAGPNDEPNDEPCERKPSETAARASASVAFATESGYSSPIDLGEEDGRAFFLGEQSDPARVRVWRRGDQFLLQQVGGPPVAVGGMPLQSPIVVLEDGDEVSCDSDVMRITVRPPLASSEGSA